MVEHLCKLFIKSHSTQIDLSKDGFCALWRSSERPIHVPENAHAAYATLKTSRVAFEAYEFLHQILTDHFRGDRAQSLSAHLWESQRVNVDLMEIAYWKCRSSSVCVQPSWLFSKASIAQRKPRQSREQSNCYEHVRRANLERALLSLTAWCG